VHEQDTSRMHVFKLYMSSYGMRTEYGILGLSVHLKLELRGTIASAESNDLRGDRVADRQEHGDCTI
jgi:hypothetical protein